MLDTSIDAEAVADADQQRALRGAAAGDEAAFATLWKAQHPPLVRYLRVRDPEVAEDVAAETWLQVVRDLPGFTGDLDRFRAWLFTIARHRAIDAARARASRPSTPSGSGEEVGAARRERAASAESEALDRVSTQAALRIVAGLPPAQAEMVMLRVVAGLEVATVAAVVGKKPGTVRVAVHRALNALAQDPRVRAVQEEHR